MQLALQRHRSASLAARLSWALPAAAVAGIAWALAWAAVESAHHRGWLSGRQWWQAALRPNARWTLLILLVLWAAALALYWWPRRQVRSNIPLLALTSMVTIGVALAAASYLPCAGNQAPVIAPLTWVLALFAGSVQSPSCPEPALPLALQLASAACLGATFVGVAAAAAVLWRREIDRVKTRFVGELTVMTGLDEMTVALLGKLVGESGGRRVVVVEADPGHPLLEEVRAAGARVIIGDPGRAEVLRPVLTHLGRSSARRVFALHPGAQENNRILATARQVLRDTRHTGHHPHIVARIDDPRHADTWRGDHIASHQLWLEDALSPYETTAVFAVGAVLAHDARSMILCGDTTLALAVLIEAARSALERRELRAAAAAGGQPGLAGSPGFPAITIMAERGEDLSREFAATVSPQLHAALPAVTVVPAPWRSRLLAALDDMPAAEAEACAVVIADAPTPESVHEAGRVARLHPRTVIYAQSADDAGSAGVVFDQLYHFRRGFLVDGALPDDTWTRLARHNHECYRLRWPEPAGSPRESARRRWHELDAFFQDENIRQVRQVLASAVALGRVWRPLRAVPPGSVMDFTEPELLVIARAEHDRWYARRLEAGWRPPRAGEAQDNAAKVNARVVPWDELPDVTRRDNAQHITAILERLEAIGYGAVLGESGPGHAACYLRHGEVRAVRLTAPHTWQAADGTVLSAQAGDWHVTDEHGHERTVRDAQFRASHDQVTGDRWARTGKGRAWRVAKPTTVQTLEGPVTAAPGDWIVQGQTGEQWPVPAGEFEHSHVPGGGWPQSQGVREHDRGQGRRPAS